MRWVSKLLFATFILAGMAALAAPNRLWHSYREVCERLGLTEFFRIAQGQRDQLRLLYKVEPAAVDGQPLVLTIRTAARAIQIMPNEEGSVDFPVDAQLLAENPDVLINLPAGEKATFTPDLRPTLPGALQVNYVRFAGGVPQANAMVRRQAGLLSVFAPTLHKLVLRYPRPEGQQVSVANGPTVAVYRVDASATIEIPFDERAYAENARVTLSAMPVSVDFAP